jgi:hypothetical protein
MTEVPGLYNCPYPLPQDTKDWGVDEWRDYAFMLNEILNKVVEPPMPDVFFAWPDQAQFLMSAHKTSIPVVPEVRQNHGESESPEGMEAQV